MTAFPELDRAQYMNITTFKRDASEVRTPVWFAQDGDTLFFFSLSRAGKLKRIRNRGQVLVAPCTMNGELLGSWTAGSARILPSDESARAAALLDRKYGLLMSLGKLYYRLSGVKMIYVEVTPGG